jgi:hypothetical protein
LNAPNRAMALFDKSLHHLQELVVDLHSE